MITPRSTRQRLLAIADLIEDHPDTLMMSAWMRVPDEDSGDGCFEEPDTPFEARHEAKNIKCGTTCCLAGWGVVLTPQSQAKDIIGKSTDWTEAGAKALGLTPAAADDLFLCSSDEQITPELLRELAEHQAPRTAEVVEAARSKVGLALHHITEEQYGGATW